MGFLCSTRPWLFPPSNILSSSSHFNCVVLKCCRERRITTWGSHTRKTVSINHHGAHILLNITEPVWTFHGNIWGSKANNSTDLTSVCKSLWLLSHLLCYMWTFIISVQLHESLNTYKVVIESPASETLQIRRFQKQLLIRLKTNCNGTSSSNFEDSSSRRTWNPVLTTFCLKWKLLLLRRINFYCRSSLQNLCLHVSDCNTLMLEVHILQCGRLVQTELDGNRVGWWWSRTKTEQEDEGAGRLLLQLSGRAVRRNRPRIIYS